MSRTPSGYSPRRTRGDQPLDAAGSTSPVQRTPSHEEIRDTASLVTAGVISVATAISRLGLTDAIAAMADNNSLPVSIRDGINEAVATERAGLAVLADNDYRAAGTGFIANITTGAVYVANVMHELGQRYPYVVPGRQVRYYETLRVGEPVILDGEVVGVVAAVVGDSFNVGPVPDPLPPEATAPAPPFNRNEDAFASHIALPTSAGMTMELQRRRNCNVMNTMPWRDDGYQLVRLLTQIGDAPCPSEWPGVTIDRHMHAGLNPGTIALSKRNVTIMNSGRFDSEYRIDVYLGWLLWHPITQTPIVGPTTTRQLAMEYLALRTEHRIDVICSAALADLMQQVSQEMDSDVIPILRSAMAHYRQCWTTERGTNPEFNHRMLHDVMRERAGMDRWARLFQERTSIENLAMLLSRLPVAERTNLLMQMARQSSCMAPLQVLLNEVMPRISTPPTRAETLERRRANTRMPPARPAPLPPRQLPVAPVLNDEQNEAEDPFDTPQPPPPPVAPPVAIPQRRFRHVHIRNT